MCLGVPGKIETIVKDAHGVRMGQVSFGGIGQRVCLDLVPEAVVGDYVLVHVGFAISCLDEREAEETLVLLTQIGVIEETG